MKKKILTSIILIGLLICSFAGCKKEEPLPVCSGCEEQKECQTYVVDGQDYIVCDDCYNEFAYAFGLIDDEEETEEVPAKPKEIPICSLCEQEKECDTYTVDSQKYVVCPDCYNEFAHAFGLINDEPEAIETPTPSETNPVLVCGGCEEEKPCKIYDIDGQEYVVCDDCYEEFALGMGITE